MGLLAVGLAVFHHQNPVFIAMELDGKVAFKVLAVNSLNLLRAGFLNEPAFQTAIGFCCDKLFRVVSGNIKRTITRHRFHLPDKLYHRVYVLV